MRNVEARGRVDAINPTGHPLTVRLGGRLRSVGPAPPRVAIRYPDGRVTQLRPSPRGTPFSRVLRLQPGRSVATLTAVGAASPGAASGARPAAFQLADDGVVAEAVWPFLPGPPRAHAEPAPG